MQKSFFVYSLVNMSAHSRVSISTSSPGSVFAVEENILLIFVTNNKALLLNVKHNS